MIMKIEDNQIFQQSYQLGSQDTTLKSKSELSMQIALKNSQLANIDKKEFENDIQVSLSKQDYFAKGGVEKDQNDYEQVLQKLKAKDQQIKSHEQTHSALSGANSSNPHYNYQVGPDGKMYAVGGSVTMDTSIKIDPNNQNSTSNALLKLDQLQKATSSVDEPSSADMSIATKANFMKIRLQMQTQDEQNN